MINLSFDELRLIAQLRNISDYENRSKEGLIKALSETKQIPKPETAKPETPKPKPKPETPKPKSETSKLETKPTRTKNRTKTRNTKNQKKTKTETPKPEIRVNKRKLRKLRKGFDELRYKFSKKEIDRYRKAFYVAKTKNIFLNQK